MPSSHPSIQVAAALIIKEGMCLITQRTDRSHLAGFWEFPGGKIKKGESPQECVVRELEEELGIQVQAGALVYQVNHTYPEKDVTLFFYQCEIIKGIPQALEVEQFRWVDLDKLGYYRFPPADNELIKILSAM